MPGKQGMPSRSKPVKRSIGAVLFERAFQPERALRVARAAAIKSNKGKSIVRQGRVRGHVVSERSLKGAKDVRGPLASTEARFRRRA